MSDSRQLYRKLPSMDELLAHPGVRAWIDECGCSRDFARGAASAFLDRLRRGIAAETLDAAALEALLGDPAAGVRGCGAARLATRLRRVVNGTGVVVHTNLGRSPWSPAAAARVADLATAYLNLELDLEGGERGGRDRPAADLFARLIPGADVAVVNNNAAAVLLVLNTFAEGREVVVSRGQLVEIGGSFRIPDVMAKGFCRLREVGTTNRTRIDDYGDAIGPETGLLLAVHPSNYRVVGFTAEVDLEELVALGREHAVPVVEDLGSGNLVGLSDLGIDEPTVAERLASGVDLVTFSGDKLLGGPQAGFIAGRPEAVARVRANPLYRALRLDKAMYLAIEATLLDYLAGREQAVPTLRMLRRSAAEIRDDAEALAMRLGESVPALSCRVVRVESRVGGGAAPEIALPSHAISLDSELSADALAARLRGCEPAVVGRVVEDRLLIDVRTLLPGDGDRLESALRQALEREPGNGA